MNKMYNQSDHILHKFVFKERFRGLPSSKHHANIEKQVDEKHWKVKTK